MKTDVCGRCGFELGAGPDLLDCPACHVALAFAVPDADETPPPAQAIERIEGILMAWGGAWVTWSGGGDRDMAARMPELTCVLSALIDLGRQHPDALHRLYLERRRQPMPFGVTPPAYVKPKPTR